MNSEISFYGKTAVFWTDGKLPNNTIELVTSEFVRHVIHKFVTDLRSKESPFTALLSQGLSEQKQEKQICTAFRWLVEMPIDEIKHKTPEFSVMFSDQQLLHQFVEEFYNYWRNFERYLVCTSNPGTNYDKAPYTAFNETVEQ